MPPACCSLPLKPAKHDLPRVAEVLIRLEKSPGRADARWVIIRRDAGHRRSARHRNPAVDYGDRSRPGRQAEVWGSLLGVPMWLRCAANEVTGGQGGVNERRMLVVEAGRRRGDS